MSWLSGCLWWFVCADAVGEQQKYRNEFVRVARKIRKLFGIFCWRWKCKYLFCTKIFNLTTNTKLRLALAYMRVCVYANFRLTCLHWHYQNATCSGAVARILVTFFFNAAAWHWLSFHILYLVAFHLCGYVFSFYFLFFDFWFFSWSAIYKRYTFKS